MLYLQHDAAPTCDAEGVDIYVSRCIYSHRESSSPAFTTACQTQVRTAYLKAKHKVWYISAYVFTKYIPELVHLQRLKHRIRILHQTSSIEHLSQIPSKSLLTSWNELSTHLLTPPCRDCHLAASSDRSLIERMTGRSGEGGVMWWTSLVRLAYCGIEVVVWVCSGIWKDSVINVSYTVFG